MVRTLVSHPYAQARVIYDGDGDFLLVSYSTPVVHVNDGIISVLGLYSATTRKHISAFMRELGLDYSIAKKCFEDSISYDIYNKCFCQLIVLFIILGRQKWRPLLNQTESV